MRLRRGAHAVRRHWLVSSVVALVVVAGAGGWFLLRPDNAAAQSQTITSTVTAGTVKQTVSADGTITPTTTDTVTFPSGGTVTSVLVAVGDKVTKGEVLARMDTASLEATRDAADATLDSAEDQYATDEDDDAGSTQLASDRAQIVSAKAALASAQDDLDDATMTAPVTGRVSAIGYSVGDSTGSSDSGAAAGSSSSSVSSTSTSTSGITVISTGSYEVDATVDSSDLAQLKKGQQATITPTGASSAVYGVVSGIGVVASSTEGSSTSSSSSSSASFPVTIKVTGSTKGIYAGSSATVSITVKQLTNALTVPTQALSTTSGKTYVTLVKNGKDTRRYVSVGDTYGSATVVTKGLESGDTVLIASFRAPTSSGSGNQQRSGGFGGGTGSGTGGPPSGGGFGSGGAQ